MAQIIIKSDNGNFIWKKKFTGEDIYYMHKESYGLLNALNEAADEDEKEEQ